MQINHWLENLEASIAGHKNERFIGIIFSSILDYILQNEIEGACHLCCGIIHVLLNEAGIENIWHIGEIKVGNYFSDHSWITIDNRIFDVAICNPLDSAGRCAPVINDLDIEKNAATAVKYGVISGGGLDASTEHVKKMTLTDFLLGAPVHPTVGAWYLIDLIGRTRLRIPINLPKLFEKYDRRCFSAAESLNK